MQAAVCLCMALFTQMEVNMYLGYEGDKIKLYTEQPLDDEILSMFNIDKVEETEDEYALNADGTEYVLKDEVWEEEQKRKERERLDMLSLTRGDVFRGLLQAKGVTKAQLRAGIEAMPEGLQKEMALIDFDEALNFYRGNTLVDTVGATLGITSEQLDRFFETNDYHELISEDAPVENASEGEENPTQTEETLENDTNTDLEGEQNDNT